MILKDLLEENMSVLYTKLEKKVIKDLKKGQFDGILKDLKFTAGRFSPENVESALDGLSHIDKNMDNAIKTLLKKYK